MTIIDGNDTTRAFVAWGDRFFNEDSENANDSGPKDWVLEGMTIQNCIADTNNRFSYTSAAYNLKTNFAELDTDASGGLNPEEANGQVGGIRLAGADGEEGTEDDDLHRFAHIDTDGSDELSEAELDANYVPSAGSPSIDADVDPATVGVTLTTDYNGNARPQGAGYDIGAFEVAPPAE